MAAFNNLSTLDVSNATSRLTVEEMRQLVFQMGVSLKFLDDIADEYKGENKKQHFIQIWLDMDPNASWDKLAAGLRKINKNSLATEIESEYLSRALVPRSTSSSLPSITSSVSVPAPPIVSTLKTSTPAPIGSLPPAPLPATPAPVGYLPPAPLTATPAPVGSLPPAPLTATPAPAGSLPPAPLTATPAPVGSLPPAPLTATPAPVGSLPPAPLTATPAPVGYLTPAPLTATPAPVGPLPPAPLTTTPAPVGSLPSIPLTATPAPVGSLPPALLTATPAPVGSFPPAPLTASPAPVGYLPTAPLTSTPAPVGSFPPAPLTATPAPVGYLPPAPLPASPAPVGYLPPAPLTASLAPVGSLPPAPLPATPAPVGSLPPAPLPATPAPVGPLPPAPLPATPAPVGPLPPAPLPATPAPVGPLPPAPLPATPAPVGPLPSAPLPATPAPTDPLTNPSQTAVVFEQRVEETRDAIEQFEEEFSDMKFEAQKVLTNKQNENIEFVERFQNHLLNMPVTKKQIHIRFFTRNEDEILNAKTIQKLFAILGRYCNYSNYEIIFHIVKKFCHHELKGRMLRYRDSLTSFEKSTTVDVYLCAISAPPAGKIREGFIRMTMKINKPSSECTLYEIRELKESIEKEASLESYAMYIETPGEGSVHAKLLIPWKLYFLVAGVLTPEFREVHFLTEVMREKWAVDNLVRIIVYLTSTEPSKI